MVESEVTRLGVRPGVHPGSEWAWVRDFFDYFSRSAIFPKQFTPPRKDLRFPDSGPDIVKDLILLKMSLDFCKGKSQLPIFLLGAGVDKIR